MASITDGVDGEYSRSRNRPMENRLSSSLLWIQDPETPKRGRSKRRHRPRTGTEREVRARACPYSHSLPSLSHRGVICSRRQNRQERFYLLHYY